MQLFSQTVWRAIAFEGSTARRIKHASKSIALPLGARCGKRGCAARKHCIMMDGRSGEVECLTASPSRVDWMTAEEGLE